MIYLERTPHGALRPFVRMLWYARGGHHVPRRERILPTGRVQVILSLARSYLFDCREGSSDRREAPSLVVGARSVYEVIDSSDLEDLIGVVFEHAGFSTFARDAVHHFSNRSVCLEDVWGPAARTLRDRLLEVAGPEERLACFEGFLASRMGVPVTRNEVVRSALKCFRSESGVATVREVARSTGYGERRFRQLFEEEVDSRRRHGAASSASSRRCNSCTRVQTCVGQSSRSNVGTTTSHTLRMSSERSPVWTRRPTRQAARDGRTT